MSAHLPQRRVWRAMPHGCAPLSPTCTAPHGHDSQAVRMLSPGSLTLGPTVMRLVTGHAADDTTHRRSASEHGPSAGMPGSGNGNCGLRAWSAWVGGLTHQTSLLGRFLAPHLKNPQEGQGIDRNKGGCAHPNHPSSAEGCYCHRHVQPHSPAGRQLTLELTRRGRRGRGLSCSRCNGGIWGYLLLLHHPSEPGKATLGFGTFVVGEQRLQSGQPRWRDVQNATEREGTGPLVLHPQMTWRPLWT